MLLGSTYLICYLLDGFYHLYKACKAYESSDALVGEGAAAYEMVVDDAEEQGQEQEEDDDEQRRTSERNGRQEGAEGSCGETIWEAGVARTESSKGNMDI